MQSKKVRTSSKAIQKTPSSAPCKLYMIITSLLLLGKLSLWTYTDQIRIGFQHFDRLLTNLGHKLVSKLWSPEVTGVAPRTHPGEVTPRIPHSHQPGCYQWIKHTKNDCKIHIFTLSLADVDRKLQYLTIFGVWLPDDPVGVSLLFVPQEK